MAEGRRQKEDVRGQKAEASPVAGLNRRQFNQKRNLLFDSVVD